MILSSPINLEMVNAFRGTVDFYYWKGIPCAREWPRPPRQPGTPAQQATWDAFKDMFAWKQSNPLRWNEKWAVMTVPATMSAEDCRRKFGLRLAYKDALYRPPDITLITITPNSPMGKTTVRVFVDDYAEYDGSKIDFRLQGYNSGFKTLEWYESYKDVNRQGVPTTRYEPIITEYLSPESVNWNDDLDIYTLTMGGIFTSVSLFGVVDKPTAADIMLSALYDSQDF